MIEFKNVTKYYDGKLALDNISFKIPEGEIFGIIGKSGAGKSTLIRTINKIEDIDSGSVIIDNINITNCDKNTLSSIRRQIGFVFQNFNLLEMKNVYQNVELALKSKKMSKQDRQEKIYKSLELVGLQGYETKYIHQLSGGEKQRVGIARALCLDPKILLCDEATSALDPLTTNQILKLVYEINQKLNISVVVITHEMEVIRKICDSVAVLADGCLIEKGSVLNVFKNTTSEKTKDILDNVFNDDYLFDKNTDNNIYNIHYDEHIIINDILSNCCKDFTIVSSQLVSTRQGKYYRILLEVTEECSDFIKCLEEKNIRCEVLR